MKENGFINEKLTPKHEEEEAAATAEKKKEMHEKEGYIAVPGVIELIKIEHGDFFGYRVNEIFFLFRCCFYLAKQSGFLKSRTQCHVDDNGSDGGKYGVDGSCRYVPA